MENSIDKELRLKYRPTTFDEFVGNESMVNTLISKLESDSFPHTSLFIGPSGCGKTTLARIIAKKLGCSEFDFKEYLISDMRGIDTAREIISRARLAPMDGKVKVYVLDEFHKATNEFQNAMLGVFEDPPKHVYFIMCTTDPEKIIHTIKGQRATIFKVERLKKKVIISLLQDICDKEGVEFSEKHLREIAENSQGSPRAALNILDRIIDIEDDQEAFDAILDDVDEVSVKNILDLLMTKSGKPTWKKMSELIKKLDVDPETTRLSIKKYFGSVFLNTGDHRHYEIMSLFLQPFYSSGREGLIEALYLACKI